MRALLYPSRGFVPDALAEQLARSGHELISWGSDEEWAPALAAATAVFHLLHGHEEHARQTVLQLLRRQAVRACDDEGACAGAGCSPCHARQPLLLLLLLLLPGAVLRGRDICRHQHAGDMGGRHASAGRRRRRAAGRGCGACATSGADRQGRAKQVRRRCSAHAAPCCSRPHDRRPAAAAAAAARRPAPCAAATHALEQLLLSSSRAGVLRCYVVCPGLLYGRGGEEPLLPLFRAAWEGGEPLPLLGPGTNLLPTLHVSNLAAYAEAVATQQPGGSAYLLAADEAPVSTAALVAGLGQLLGQPQAR